jgi:hypothetical protein
MVLRQLLTEGLLFYTVNIGVKWYRKYKTHDGVDVTGCVRSLVKQRMIQGQGFRSGRVPRELIITFKGMAHIYTNGETDERWDTMSQAERDAITEG